MRFPEISIVLACPSIEDAPATYSGKAAGELLAAWSAAWHPESLASSRSLPGWFSMDEDLPSLEDHLLLVPGGEDTELGLDLERLRGAGESGQLVCELTDRSTAISALRRHFSDTVAGKADDRLADEFAALAFAYLMMDLLALRMGYGSHLDQGHLESIVVSAAEAAVADKPDEAREALGRAFDVLGEARDYFYPVESYFVEVLLLAPSVWGAPLRQRLAAEQPTNVLVTGEAVAALAAAEPESLAALRGAVESGTACLLGGNLDSPRDLPLFSLEEMRARFQTGLGQCVEQLGDRPKIYASATSDFSPLSPQLLPGLGFDAVLFSSFDGRKLPRPSQCRVKWKTRGGDGIDTLAVTPRDASSSATLLRLASDVGESMDRDHVATCLYAYWPGHACPAFGDLLRAVSLTPALGRFITLADYFADTTSLETDFRPRADSLTRRAGRTAAADGCLSAPVRQAQQTADESCRQILAGLHAIVSGGGVRPAASETDPDRTTETRDWSDLLSAFGTAIAPPAANPSGAPGFLVVNTSNRSQTMFASLSSPPESTTSEPDGASLWGPPPTHFFAKVPPLGYAWQSRSAPPSPPVALAEGRALRNEIYEATLDSQTGGIRAVHLWSRRGNLLSQQLAVRLAKESSASPSDGPRYSRMLAESLTVSASTAACGEITSSGRLVGADDETLARFRQQTRVLRQLPVVFFDVHLELEPSGEETLRAGGSCVWSMALGGEPDQVMRSVHGTMFSDSGAGGITTGCLELETAGHRVALFPCGLPHDQRVGPNRLDVPLVVRGEPARRFRLAVGVDLPAAELLEPLLTAGCLATAAACPRPRTDSAWLLRVSAPHVAVTHVGPRADGKGLRLRLLETRGRAARTKLDACRPLTAARQTDLQGGNACEIPIRDGQASLELTPYGWTQLEVDF